MAGCSLPVSNAMLREAVTNELERRRREQEFLTAYASAVGNIVTALESLVAALEAEPHRPETLAELMESALKSDEPEEGGHFRDVSKMVEPERVDPEPEDQILQLVRLLGGKAQALYEITIAGARAAQARITGGEKPLLGWQFEFDEKRGVPVLVCSCGPQVYDEDGVIFIEMSAVANPVGISEEEWSLEAAQLVAEDLIREAVAPLMKKDLLELEAALEPEEGDHGQS